MDIIIPESIQPEFEAFLAKEIPYANYNAFSLLNYLLQSGVCKAYLRSKGVEAGAFPYVVNANTTEYRVYLNWEWKDIFSDYNEAEIAAINAGFQLRAEQLKVKKL